MHIPGKKSFLGCFLVLIFSAGSLFSQTIGISHPTVKNLKRFVYMIEHGLIEGADVRLLAVMHADQQQMLKNAKAYIASTGVDYISFEFVHGHEGVETLFQQNAYTADLKRIFEKTDAFVFNGGADIPPAIYGEPTFLTTGIYEKYRLWEMAFLFHLSGGERNLSFEPFLKTRKDYTVLGICLGMQQMNVAGGGSMYQDIPFQVYGVSHYEDYFKIPTENRHRNDFGKTRYLGDGVYSVHFHPLRFPVESYLSELESAASAQVLSAHHQALNQIGGDFSVVATSKDGKIPEAIVHKHYKNVYGIQFHPEVSEIYALKALDLGSEDKFLLDSETKGFHQAFWSDFSARIAP